MVLWVGVLQMKTFNVWRTRMWPQCFVGVIYAKDIDVAFAIAKALHILNPIVGETQEPMGRMLN